MNFTETKADEIQDNAFRLIGGDWMLITAGTEKSYNTMTASWGGFGVLWNKNVTWCVVRPSRHTYRFMEEADTFTLSFFEQETYRKQLNYCGSRSGRDVDKAAQTGLTPVQAGDGSIYFAEARLVLLCRKLYYQDLNPKNFMDSSIDQNYPNEDYHRMYFGEITSCLSR